MTYEQIIKAALEIHQDALQEMLSDETLHPLSWEVTREQLRKVEQLLEPTTRILPLFR